jgi:hypothetical protein
MVFFKIFFLIPNLLFKHYFGAGAGAGQGTTVNIAWSLCERSLGDAEYLAAMRTLILPLVKVRSNTTHDHYHCLVAVGGAVVERSLGDAEYVAAMRTLILPLVKVRSSATHDHYHSLVAV